MLKCLNGITDNTVNGVYWKTFFIPDIHSNVKVFKRNTSLTVVKSKSSFLLSKLFQHSAIERINTKPGVSFKC